MTDVRARGVGEVDTSGVPFRVVDEVFIPAERYYDPEFFALENEKLWRHTWQIACRLEEIPGVGDFVEYKILDQSFLIVRVTADVVKAFYNSCRHRATALGRGTGSYRGEQIVCPFHGWRWNLDGSNSFVYASEYFRPECLVADEVDLKEVQVGIRFGFVWINPDHDAEPLDESFHGIDAVLDAARFDLMRVSWWHRIEFKCNWKIAQEAFFESYHVMQTHPEMSRFKRDDDLNPAGMSGYSTDPQGHGWMSTVTTRGLTDERPVVVKGMTPAQFGVNANRVVWDGAKSNALEWQVELGEQIVARGVPDDEFYDVYFKELYEEADRRNLPIPPLDPNMSGHVVVFPNFTVGGGPLGAALVHRVRPTGPDTCEYDFWSLAIQSEGTPITRAIEGTGPPWEDLWFVHQDASNIERQQVGIHADSFRHMRLAPYLEELISNWHLALDQKLAAP